jgi:hypothetical protein
MRVIGAGLPRSATTTQMFALETLGFGPCYHMRDLLADLEGGLPLWEAVAEGRPDWERIFGEARSAVDWPSARYYEALMEYYPRAKVILSARDGCDWAHSMRETVWAVYKGHSVMHHMCEARAVLDPLWQRYMDVMTQMTWDDDTGALAGDTTTHEGLVAAMERWHAHVVSTVPADRLLVWNPADGWEPMCDFLEVAVPAEPMPRLNDTNSFREGIIGGAVDIVNDWWDARERPNSGLHGAPLSAAVQESAEPQ